MWLELARLLRLVVCAVYVFEDAVVAVCVDYLLFPAHLSRSTSGAHTKPPGWYLEIWRTYVLCIPPACLDIGSWVALVLRV